MYICIYMYICRYMYIYIERERERDKETERETERESEKAPPAGGVARRGTSPGVFLVCV